MLYNKHNLSVVRFAAKDGAKEELTGVLFTKDKTVATDAVRLLEVSVDTAVKVEDYPKVQGNAAMHGCKPFLASVKQLNEIKIRSGQMPILNCVAIKHLDEKSIEFMSTNLETADIKSVRRIDGKFPDYKKLFPISKPVAQFTIDGLKFAELLKVMSEIGKLGAVQVRYYGTDKPIELRADAETQRSRGLMSVIKEG